MCVWFGARICCVSFNFFCGQARKDILAGKILAHKCEAGKKTCPTCAAVQKKVDSTFIPLNFVVWKFGCLIFLDKCQHVKYEEVWLTIIADVFSSGLGGGVWMHDVHISAEVSFLIVIITHRRPGCLRERSQKTSWWGCGREHRHDSFLEQCQTYRHDAVRAVVHKTQGCTSLNKQASKQASKIWTFPQTFTRTSALHDQLKALVNPVLRPPPKLVKRIVSPSTLAVIDFCTPLFHDWIWRGLQLCFSLEACQLQLG